MRSNCTLVTTLGAKPKPNSPRRRGVEGLEAGREHHAADFQLDGLFRLLVVDRAGLAHLRAQAALARPEMDAVLAVDDRHARRGLRMGQIDAGPGTQILVERREVWLHPPRGDRVRSTAPVGQTTAQAPQAWHCWVCSS